MPLVNPPAALLGRVNAIVGGRARRYQVARFVGPLSIKAVISGVAAWETRDGRYELGPSGCLVLHAGEEYSIEVDSLQPVETFCIFFQQGFVEDARRAIEGGSAALLDDSAPPPEITFGERLQFDLALREALVTASTHRSTDHEQRTTNSDHEDLFFHLAAHLVRSRAGADARMARIPALRSATRWELLRRLERGVALMHANLDRALSVEEIARTACLSTFHFHRLFAAAFGETPHRYLTRLRLERAAALFRGSERSVADVALSCGFESPGSFTTLFTRRFGTPPARFRRNGEVALPAAR
jgi:AraC-like DNA-binding protein